MGHDSKSSVAVSTKSCVVCGVDCAGRPRVKAPSGRYYCRSCYDAQAANAAAALSAPAHAASPAAADDIPNDDGMFDANLLALEPMAPMEVVPGRGSVAWPPASSKRASPRGPTVRPGVWLTERLSAIPSMAGLASLIALLIAFATLLPESIQNIALFVGGAFKGDGPGWRGVLGLACIASVTPSLLMWLLGPWWFSARVRWAGGKSLEAPVPRTIYFASSLPFALLMLPLVLLQAVVYASPVEAYESSSFFFDLIVPIMGWGLLIAGCVMLFLVSWQGLGAKMGGSLFWFIVLPLGWYAMTIASTFTLMAVLSNIEEIQKKRSAPQTATQLSSPQHFAPTAGAPYDFSYPSNWNLRVQDVAGVNYKGVSIEGPDGSALALLLVPPTEVEDDYLIDLMSKKATGGTVFRNGQPISTMGPFRGKGHVNRSAIQGVPAQVTMFLRPVSSGARLVLCSIRRDPDVNGAQHGIDLILSSLKVTER